MVTLLKRLTTNSDQLLRVAKEQVISSVRELSVRLVEISELEDKILAKAEYPIRQNRISTPKILEMELEAGKEHLRQDEYVFPSLYTALIQDLIYCPWHNILLTQSRQVISDSVGTKRQHSRFSFRRLYWGKLEKIPGVCCVFRSSTLQHTRNYSHTLIDNLSRLWLLSQSKLLQDQEVKILFSSAPNELENFFIENFVPKNFKIVVIDYRKLYACEQILFAPVITKRGAGAIPREYAEFLLEKLRPQRSRQQGKRIYISRSKRGLRSILNEDLLMEFLSQYGFKKFCLETMSMAEKIELFYDAEYVIGAYGAGMANLVFSEETKVVELFPTDFVAPNYYFLSKSLGHHYLYCCGKEHDINKNFEVDISAIQKALEDQGI